MLQRLRKPVLMHLDLPELAAVAIKLQDLAGCATGTIIPLAASPIQQTLG
jgi:hypothetical protein